jgi:hypothetical protein
MHVISNSGPVVIAADDEHDARLVWIGLDDRDIELEIVAIELADLMLVIHVMPTQLRRRGSRWLKSSHSVAT